MNRLLIAAFTLAALILPASLVRAQADTQGLKDKPAPEIQLKTLDGKDFKLSDLKGDVVVLDFWATWCPPCREGLPHIQALNDDKARAEKGLKVFAVNSQEKKAAVEKFLKDNNLSFAVPMDEKGEAGTAYKVRGIPTTVVVGRDGTIKNVFVGFAKGRSEQPLDNAVDAALKEGKPKPAAAR